MTATQRRSILRRAACCAMFAILLALPSTAAAALTMNLRFADGSTTRRLTLSDVGTDIPIDVWATVTGTGEDEEGFQFAFYSIVSSIQGTLPAGGNLAHGALVAPFDVTGSSLGALANISNDGIGDVGSVSNNIPTVSHAKPRSNVLFTPSTPGDTSLPITNGREWHVQQVLFHVDSVAIPSNFNGVLDIWVSSAHK